MKDFKKMPKMADGGSVDTPKIKTRKPTVDEGWKRDFANKLAQTPVDNSASVFNRENNIAKSSRDRGVQEFNKLPEEVRNYEGLKAMKKGGKVKRGNKKK